MNPSTLCEHVDCERDGWVVLHFGPHLTPPLRIACMTHQSVSDLSEFRDRSATTEATS